MTAGWPPASTLRAVCSFAFWADGYEEVDGSSISASWLTWRGPAGHALIISRTPSDPNREGVSLARFPKDAVEDVIFG